MDENQGWAESARALWEELVYGEGIFRAFRLLLGLLIIIGLLWSLFVFKQFVNLSQSSPPAFPDGTQAQAAEVAKLDSLVKSYPQPGPDPLGKREGLQSFPRLPEEAPSRSLPAFRLPLRRQAEAAPPCR